MVVDDFIKELVGILVEYGISGFCVIWVLDEMVWFCGYLKVICIDQGFEFIGKVFD